MKKEKKIRTYQRRTKSGKMVTVKAHTAKYDAAERAREAAKKKGAGEELEAKKKGLPKRDLSMEDYLEELRLRQKSMREELFGKTEEAPKKSKKESTKKEASKASEKKVTKSTAKETKSANEPAFTAAEFKEWYHGTGSAADKKVAKALRAQLGRSGYRKFEDEAIDNYTSRGHLSMFKRVSGDGGVKETTKPKEVKKASAKSKQDAEIKSATKDIARGSQKASKRVISADHVKRYADFEDIDVKTARKELSEMSDKEYQKSAKKYSDEAKKDAKRTTSIKGGKESDIKKAMTSPFSGAAKRLTGKEAIEAKKSLIEGGFEQKKGKYGDVYLKKGNSIYQYTPAGLYVGGAHLVKVSGEKLSEAKELFSAPHTLGTATKSPKRPTKLDSDSDAVKGAKRELRGYGKQTPSTIARIYGKDSKEYKGYAELSATPVPKDPKKAAVRNAVLQGFGRAGDDTCRDLLVANGYPPAHAYSKGIKEITSLAKKYGIDW